MKDDNGWAHEPVCQLFNGNERDKNLKYVSLYKRQSCPDLKSLGLVKC